MEKGQGGKRKGKGEGERESEEKTEKGKRKRKKKRGEYFNSLFEVNIFFHFTLEDRDSILIVGTIGGIQFKERGYFDKNITK